MIEVAGAGNFSLEVVDGNGCVSPVSQEVVFTELECDEIIVYNAISPDNGDELNDHLIIKNIERTPASRDNTLRIFNRWGDVVFEAKGYDNVTNPFRGATNSGKPLPSGTYFYILEFSSGLPRMTGYLSVRR